MSPAKEKWISDLFGGMDIERKVGQLMVFSFAGPVITPDVVELITRYHLGGLRVSLKFRTTTLTHDVKPGTTPNEISEEQFAQALEETASRLPPSMPMILVSHQPPLDTKADAIASGRHVGSRSVRQFIRDRQPLLCFTGHIHEGVGLDTIGRCQVINPGPLREGRYAWAMLGETVAGPTVTACEVRKV